MSKKPVRIVFGKGNFICYVCEKQFTQFEKGKLTVMDENEDYQSVCKFCEKHLDPEDFERKVHPIMGAYFIKRDKKKKWLYMIKKKLGLDY